MKNWKILFMFALIVSLMVFSACMEDDEEDEGGEANACDGVTCGTNASCVAGDCVCDDGYPVGDPDTGCTADTDPCEGVTCGTNARCVAGDCVCLDGYSGDPDTECTEDVDPCDGVTCGANAHCDAGDCVCDTGYIGDPDTECTQDPCVGVTCGTNAHCDAGDCVCDDGYTGDPDTECTLIPDLCDGVTCGANATCVDGLCVCDAGYTGNPYTGCGTAPTTCTGACDPNSEMPYCLADTRTSSACACHPDNSTWVVLNCNDYCVGDGATSGVCGFLPYDELEFCTCTYDCSNSTDVDGYCSDLAYNNCTCAASDPCEWIADQYCDDYCMVTYPDDSLDDSADCAE